MYFALITYIHLRRFAKTYSNSFYGTKMKQKKPFDIVEFSRVVDASGFWYPNLATLFLELVSCKTNTQRKKCKQ